MKKIILDVDTGIDDALAIAYATKSKDLDVLGLTTTFGNVQVKDATRNTQFILQMLEKDIPVYEGSDKPLNQQEPYLAVAQKVHGNDGLANKLEAYDVVTEEKQTGEAISFIIDTVKKYPNEVTLIFVGPLTNLAKVYEQAPEVATLIKEIIVMGGAVTVPGNVRSHAEANIFSDPEAAKRVLQSDLPITLVGLDVTMQTLLSREEVKRWEKTDSEASKFFANITNYYIDFYESFRPGIGGCGLHDPLAIGRAIDPTFVQTRAMNVDVHLDEALRGNTFETEKTTKNTSVCLEVDVQRFLDHFVQTINF